MNTETARPHKWGPVLLVFAVCFAVRLIALDADPPAWLSWSSGVYTDEGFYTLDARHEALFGTGAPGNFHDRLVSPLLSFLQQGVFTLGRAGVVQARLVSVVAGLLTVAVFWGGLRRVFGERAALWGALFLGLAPPFVFYNRLALQETPTVFWLVLAWALCVMGRKAQPGRTQTLLFALAGAAAAVAVVCKPLAALALPGLAVGVWRNGKAAGLAFAAVLSLYGLLWYAPHHVELARMGHYYRTHQFQPHALSSVWLNVRRGFVDPERGALPYLLRLLPAPCLLIVSRLRRLDPVFTVWFLGGLAFCLLSSYAPDRYYVLFLPALCGLAAVRAARLPRWGQGLALGLFVLSSGFWYVRAWDGRSWAHRDASRTLTQTLPAGSVVIGDMAPALCLDTRFRAAPVQPGLSNDDRPVERLGATHIAVTRAPDWQRWWRAHYPAIVQPGHLVVTLALHGRLHLVVDVYQVKERTP